MAHAIINIGRLPNDGAGDSLRVAFDKVNTNFSSLFEVNPSLVFDPIKTGGAANDGTGDTLIVAFEKLNKNFNRLYAVAPDVQVVQFSMKDPWRTTFEKINSSFNNLFQAIVVNEAPATPEVEVITPVEQINDASYTGNISITNNFNIYLPNNTDKSTNKLGGPTQDTLSTPPGPFGPQEWINIGAQPNDGTGDPLRVAFEKINNNFSNLFFTTTTTYEAYSDGLTQNQVLLEIPIEEFTQGKFQIQSSDEDSTASQDITLSAQLTKGTARVKFTGYGTTFADTTGICNYDMDVANGNVRILTNPIANTTIFHFIAAQVTYTTTNLMTNGGSSSNLIAPPNNQLLLEQ